ncbi:MAG TPA: class I SAM-dependent RNA methyltransferase, partial [Candidatus Saccharimonadales bacterium]|nr:class I SAM-dependent RNA methyltransferase [Candidatus Saccharimonadales bacterium]
PLQIGERLILTIDDIAFGGEGVGRVNDFVVFVPFVLVGEVVEIEIIQVKKHFAQAKLLHVKKSSPERIEPSCRYFGKCGGCQYQHVEYAAQLRLKRKQIADLFERVGKFSPDVVQAVVPCPQPYGYRNRIMVRSQWNKPEQKLNIGFIRWDSGLVEDIEECKIAEPALNEQLQQVRAHPPARGGLKVVLRTVLEEWDIPPDSFFQNNFFVLPKLVETVREFLFTSGSQNLVDLYCGVGFFGIELAGAVESFVGVEYDRRAIQSARKNAESRYVTNGEFISAKVEETLLELLKKFPLEKTTVLLDPPRKGCPPQTLKRLREAKPAQIIYISCHPATMARDLNILCANDVFNLARVQPLDMFPQTQHVECVAELCVGERLAKLPAMDSTERTR